MLAITTLGAELAPIAPDTSSTGITTLRTVDLSKILPTKTPTPAENGMTVMTPASADVLQKIKEDVGTTPWYKNWKIMVPVGVGALGVLGLAIWLFKPSS